VLLLPLLTSRTSTGRTIQAPGAREHMLAASTSKILTMLRVHFLKKQSIAYQDPCCEFLM